MKMYKIRSWGFEITEVEIVRKSESSVWLFRGGIERREAGHDYYNSWEEAKQAIVDRNEKDVEQARKQLEYKQKALLDAISLIKHDKN